MSKRWLEEKVKDLEHVASTKLGGATEEAIMSEIILAEWGKAWDGHPEWELEAALEDLFTRLKTCPVTADLGHQLARYKEVLLKMSHREEPSQDTRDDFPE